MTFDRYWTIYEQRHGPQPLDLKDLAFQVWTDAAEAKTEKADAAEAKTEKADAAKIAADAAEDTNTCYEEGKDVGYRDALDDIETWAKADAESDPVTAKSLIDHLDHVRSTL